MRSLAIPLAALTLLTLTAPALFAQPAATPYTHVLTHDGVDREALVLAPEDAAPSAPIVLALHGATGSGARFAEARRDLIRLTLQQGWTVAFPTGTDCLRGRGACWDDRDAPQTIARADADDVGYLRALVRDLHVRHGIDTTHVFVTGFSNGAGMAYRFAAEAPDLVAAAVAVGGTVGRTRERTDYDYAMTPPPAGPVAVLVVRGMDDDLMPYHGGVRPQGRFQVLAAEYDASFWAEANGCDLAAVVNDGTSYLRDQRTDGVETHTYRAGCAAPVQLVGVGGLGHAWPTASDGFDGAAAAIDFFAQQTR
ncbi:MAG: PHB depolymerase family esterase [Bacteroidota bacterium]